LNIANHIILNYLVLIVVILAMMVMLVIIYNYFHKQKIVLKNEIQVVKEVHERTLLSTQLEIQEQTFGHISREIHDHVGQRLTLARFYLSSISDKKEDTLILADTASNLIAEAITDLKQLSRSLTSSVIEDNGLLYALEQEVTRIQRLFDWTIKLRVFGESKFISTENELILFRIVQEAIQNIIKYADPKTVLIDFYFTAEKIALEIKDDGKGFEISKINTSSFSEKSGLANMKKRTNLLNGSMRIESTPGKGTTLSFIFPLNNTYA
jgi:signal transduction histidine kinase